MMNVLLDGTKRELSQAFQAAGRVQVAQSVEQTVVAGLIDSLSKQDTLPCR
jgi:hypothetical protein